MLEGAYVIIEGNDMGNLTFNYALPDNESVSLKLSRHDSYKNFIDAEIDYYANTGKTFTGKFALKWSKNDTGCELEIKNFSLYADSELLAEGYFIGSIEKTHFDSDVFDGKDEYLYSFEAIDWRDIRNDVEGFVKSIIAKMSLGAIFGN